MTSNNLKEQIRKILSRIQTKVEVEYPTELTHFELTGRDEATAQILQLFQDYAMGCVGERYDTTWRGKELNEPENPIDIVTDVAGAYGERCWMDGYNQCRQDILDNLEGKS